MRAQERRVILRAGQVDSIWAGVTSQLRKRIAWVGREPSLHVKLDRIDQFGTAVLSDGSLIRNPFGTVGDRLWVAEPHAIWHRPEIKEGELVFPAERGVYYPGDGTSLHLVGKWAPASRMPRWASRLTLEVTSIGVQRLHDMSEEDAMREGATKDCLIGYYPAYMKEPYRYCHAQLWDHWNGNGSWEKNPWTWVIGVKLVDVHFPQ